MSAAPADLRLAPDLAERLRDGTWTEITSGSWSRVWRVEPAGGGPTLAVKLALDVSADGTPGNGGADGRLAREAECLSWVAARAAAADLPVPDVVAAPTADPGLDPVLVTTFLEGEADLRLLGSSERATEALGRTLAAVHAIDPTGCPFDASLETLLAEAGARVDAGLVTRESLQPALQPFTPERLLTHVRAMAPEGTEPADQVLVHGDLCVTNLLVDPRTGAATGVLDWGRCGIGDRYLDLAVTARSVVRNFGGEALPGFFAAYGETNPDPLRLELYSLLDELS